MRFGVGMVTRAGEQLALAQHIQARVAAMHPMQHAVLHHRRHHRGARRVQQGLRAGVTDDLVVRRHHADRQEIGHHGQARVRAALELRGKRLQGNLGRHLAVGVPTHAIGQHEQARVARVAIAHAVFVLLAPSDATELKDGELHARRPCSRMPTAAAQVRWPRSRPLQRSPWTGPARSLTMPRRREVTRQRAACGAWGWTIYLIRVAKWVARLMFFLVSVSTLSSPRRTFSVTDSLV